MAAFIIGKANEKSINGEENGIIFHILEEKMNPGIK